MLKSIIVASHNPVKIEASQAGFEKMFPDFEFESSGVSAPSGVSDQPMGEDETLTGATQRAENAKAAYPTADFWIGIEGGISIRKNKMEAFAWIVILDKEMKGEARTASFQLPPKVAELVQQGHELGDADDMVFGATNSKQKNGAVGLLSKNAMTRKELYIPAVLLACIPFKNKSLYAPT